MPLQLPVSVCVPQQIHHQTLAGGSYGGNLYRSDMMCLLSGRQQCIVQKLCSNRILVCQLGQVYCKAAILLRTYLDKQQSDLPQGCY